MRKTLITFSLILAATFALVGVVKANWLTDLFSPEEPIVGGTTLTVPRGGTGSTSFTAGECLVGAGTGALTSQACGGAGGSSTGWASSTDPTSIYFTGSGNVGIGSSTPSYKLAVSGGAYFDGPIIVPSITATSSISAPYFTATSIAQSSTFPYASTTAITSTGSAYFATVGGNVGIGNVAPNTLLSVNVPYVQDVLDPIITAQNGVATIAGIYGVKDGAGTQYGLALKTLKVNVGLTEAVRINNQGNVGIGTTVPTANLQVNGPNTGYTTLKISNDQSGTTATDGFDFIMGNDLNAFIYNRENGPIIFGTNNTEVARILSTGKVGIGTTTPAVLLHSYVATSNAVNRIQTASAGYAELQLYGSQTTDTVISSLVSYNSTDSIGAIYVNRDGANDASSMTFLTQPTGGTITERMRITSAGNVGIGTTSPGTISNRVNLRVAGGTYGGAISIDSEAAQATARLWFTSGTPVFNLDTATANDLAFGVGSTEKMRIQATSGNVGIGTTTPGAKLEINGNLLFTSTPTISSAAGDITIDAAGGSVKTPDIMQAYSFADYANTAYFVDPAGNTSGYSAILSGNVGIGTTTPMSNLTLVGASQPTIRIHNPTWAAGQESILTFSHGSGTADGVLNGGLAQIRSYVPGGGDVDLRFYTTNVLSLNSTPTLTITGDGNVGIGTTSPSTKLDVSGSAVYRNINTNLVMRGTATYSGLIFEENDMTGAAAIESTDGNLTFSAKSASGNFAGSDAKMVILNTGNVGIGTTTPYAKLSVVGQVVADYFTATTTATSTFAGGISTNLLSVTSATASSTFSNGINLSKGCFSINGTCVGGSASGVSSLAATYPLSVDAGTGAVTVSIAFGTTTENTWSQLQQFNGNASTTALSVSGESWLDGNVTQNGDLVFAGNFSITGYDTDMLGIVNDAGTITGALDISALTTDQILSFPDESGTFALLPANLKSTFIPFGDGTATLATSSLLHFDNSTLTVTYASSTSITVSGTAYFGTIDVSGGAIILPNAANPTVDSTHQLAANTTVASSSLRYWDGTAERAVSDIVPRTITVASSSLLSGTTTIPIGVSMRGETWVRSVCYTDTGTAGVQFGNMTASSTYQSLSTTINNTAQSNTFSLYQKRYMNIGTLASSPNYITCSIYFRENAD